MLRQYSILIVLLSVLVMNSCTSVYHPTRVPAMMMSEPGQVQASASISPAGNDVQATFSPIKNIGISAGMNRLSRGSFGYTEDQLYRHQSYEGSVGYWKHYDNAYFEFSGGFGWGEGQTRIVESPTQFPSTFHVYSSHGDLVQMYGNYTKTFFNGGVGFLNDDMDVLFHVRAVGGEFDRLYADLIDQETGERIVHPDFVNGRVRTFAYVDPVLTFRFGYEAVKFTGQAGLSFPVRESADISSFIFFSGGITVDIKPSMFRKSKKED